jgi:hypothetical protein
VQKNNKPNKKQKNSRLRIQRNPKTKTKMSSATKKGIKDITANHANKNNTILIQ